MADYYQTLGIEKTATRDEVKRAYRKLARKYHPDANREDPDAESRFREIGAAYEVLSDPKRRERYDRYGTDNPQMGADPFSGGMGGLFDAFFGENSPFASSSEDILRKSGPPPGEDVETYLTLDLQDVLASVRSEVSVRLAVICKHCDGSGAEPGTTVTTCPTCDGTGYVQKVRRSLLGQVVSSTTCPDCYGFGKKIEKPCHVCRSTGRVTQDRSYKIDVPAGVESGTTLRLTGRGSAGPRGGANGDLYVHVQVREHAYFRRRGNDLFHQMHIPFTQAALGAHLDYETLDSMETLVVPPGTTTGSEVRFAGKGVPSMSDHSRGDLLVRFVVDVPSDLDAEQTELVRKLAQLRGEKVDKQRKSLIGKFAGKRK